MATYRKHDWQEYFKAFEQADLTQTEFCKQHDLNPKYFSQKLAQHKARMAAGTGITLKTHIKHVVAVHFAIIFFTKLTIIKSEQ